MPMSDLDQFRERWRPLVEALRAYLEQHPPQLPHQELDEFFEDFLLPPAGGPE